jgi:hypothetical protein
MSPARALRRAAASCFSTWLGTPAGEAPRPPSHILPLRMVTWRPPRCATACCPLTRVPMASTCLTASLPAQAPAPEYDVDLGPHSRVAARTAADDVTYRPMPQCTEPHSSGAVDVVCGLGSLFYIFAHRLCGAFEGSMRRSVSDGGMFRAGRPAARHRRLFTVAQSARGTHIPGLPCMCGDAGRVLHPDRESTSTMGCRCMAKGARRGLYWRCLLRSGWCGHGRGGGEGAGGGLEYAAHPPWPRRSAFAFCQSSRLQHGVLAKQHRTACLPTRRPMLVTGSVLTINPK